MHTLDTVIMKKPTDLNILMVGSRGVGKTSLVDQYMNDSSPKAKTEAQALARIKFRGQADPSSFAFAFALEVQTHTRELMVNNEYVQLRISDTYDQQIFGLPESYYEEAHGVLIVYSVSDKESFEDVGFHIEQIKKYSAPGTEVVLLANKSDEPKKKRKVTSETGKKLADLYNIRFFETSIQNKPGIGEAFLTIASQIKEGFKDGGKHINRKLWDFDYSMKVIVLGSQRVGKKSLIHRIANNSLSVKEFYGSLGKSPFVFFF